MIEWTQELRAEAQALYDRGLQPAKVAGRLVKLHRGCRVTAADVRGAINLHRTADHTSDELRAEIRHIRKTEHLSLNAIAERLGVTRSKVERACKGIVLKRPDRTYGIRLAPAPDTRIKPKAYKPVEIPAWVPAGRLADLFANVAEREGEEHAASVIRKLKRGQSVAFT